MMQKYNFCMLCNILASHHFYQRLKEGYTGITLLFSLDFFYHLERNISFIS